MSCKVEFVERVAKGETVAALCREFGVSRTSGHKWINRFKELGYDGLEESSGRPKCTPFATAAPRKPQATRELTQPPAGSPGEGPPSARGALSAEGTPSA